MQSKRLATEQQGRRAFVIVLETGEDALAEMQRVFVAEQILSARLTGIGGFSAATLGYYDVDEKRYSPIEIDEQVEVVSFIGNVTSYRGTPRLHAHCTVGHRDGHTSGGHLLGAVVRPTLELVVQELASRVCRVDRPDVGIPLMDLDAR